MVATLVTAGTVRNGFLTDERLDYYTINQFAGTQQLFDLHRMLEQLFGSRTRLKLLRLFLTNPQEQYFVRELSRRIDERLNSVRRELANLEKIGLVQTVAARRKRYYRLNTKSVLYPELRALILKARLTVEQDIIQKLKKAGAITFLVLTGVFTGQDDAKTDILIVGRCNREKLKPIIKKLQENFDREIRYTVMSKKEFDYRQDITDRFLFDILENKNVTLIDAMKKLRRRHGAVS